MLCPSNGHWHCWSFSQTKLEHSGEEEKLLGCASKGRQAEALTSPAIITIAAIQEFGTMQVNHGDRPPHSRRCCIASFCKAELVKRCSGFAQHLCGSHAPARAHR